MDPYAIGNLLGVVLIFGWIPYKCYYTGKFVASALSNAFVGGTRPEPSKKDPLPPRTQKPKKLTVVKQETPAQQSKQATCTIEEGLETLGISLGVLKSYIASGYIRTYKEGDSLILNTDDVVKLGKKPGKRVYPVLDNFKDEHRITNPVEFDA